MSKGTVFKSKPEAVYFKCVSFAEDFFILR